MFEFFDLKSIDKSSTSDVIPETVNGGSMISIDIRNMDKYPHYGDNVVSNLIDKKLDTLWNVHPDYSRGVPVEVKYHFDKKYVITGIAYTNHGDTTHDAMKIEIILPSGEHTQLNPSVGNKQVQIFKINGAKPTNEILFKFHTPQGWQATPHELAVYGLEEVNEIKPVQKQMKTIETNENHITENAIKPAQKQMKTVETNEKPVTENAIKPAVVPIAEISEENIMDNGNAGEENAFVLKEQKVEVAHAEMPIPQPVKSVAEQKPVKSSSDIKTISIISSICLTLIIILILVIKKM